MNSKWASLLALGFVVVGCASAQIRKVPKRSDYDAQTWERERKQQYADSLCGLRFYRSRPYVNVYKPFPLESDVVLVDGVVSADGKWVQLTPNGASRKIVGDLCLLGACTPSGNLPASAVLATGSASVSKSERDVMLAQGATASGTGGGATLRAQGATDAADPTLVAPGELDRIAPHATAEDRPSGTSTLRLSTDLDAVAQTKLRDYFDIQYLPDFEEEYVVEPHGHRIVDPAGDSERASHDDRLHGLAGTTTRRGSRRGRPVLAPSDASSRPVRSAARIAAVVLGLAAVVYGTALLTGGCAGARSVAP